MLHLGELAFSILHLTTVFTTLQSVTVFAVPDLTDCTLALCLPGIVMQKLDKC